MWWVGALEAKETRLSEIRRGRGEGEEHCDEMTFEQRLNGHKGKPPAVHWESIPRRETSTQDLSPDIAYQVPGRAGKRDQLEQVTKGDRDRRPRLRGDHIMSNS